MIIETFAVKEHMDENKEIRLGYGIILLWVMLWVLTIYKSIQSAQKKKHNSGVGLLVALISWPFYWIFYFSKAIG